MSPQCHHERASFTIADQTVRYVSAVNEGFVCFPLVASKWITQTENQGVGGSNPPPGTTYKSLTPRRSALSRRPAVRLVVSVFGPLLGSSRAAIRGFGRAEILSVVGGVSVEI